MSIKSRLPTLQQALAVFGIIALMVYGWTLIWFFWKLPSWSYFLNLGEILTVLLYSLSTNLLESLFVLCIPLVLSVLLPRRWFHDRFVSMASALMIAGLGYTMYVSLQFRAADSYPKELIRQFPFAALFILFFSFLVGRINLLRKLFETLTENAIIFAYIFLPISLIALLIVIVRNIF